ncbi:epithelial-stromal interaction protein 1 isoform X2 [Petaurus breviceps papuanus]|uniref:epithelial-stromal interaction protein 1 isoform X2 n=1 Tax=Petaurus breviceps papuanus TaxID=3040969 RepID=UPI0036D8E217
MCCAPERCAPALHGHPLTMYSRTRAPFSSPAAWDSAGRRPEPGLLPVRRPGPGASHEDQSLESSRPGHRTQAHMAGFTVIAPDQIRRDKITSIAKKELEDLEKWKQQQRSRPIHTKPNKLGGNQSEAEARKKQQCQLLQSKYQQKLKRQECIRLQKEVEEAKLQATKATQREKKLPALPKDRNLARNEVLKNTLKEQENEKLHKMKDEQGKKSWGMEHGAFGLDPTLNLNQDLQPPVNAHSQRLPCHIASTLTGLCADTFLPPLLSTAQGELLELKRQWQEEERTKAHQREQRRVNNAFLDRIQGKSQPSGLYQFGGFGNMNCGRDWDV